MNYYHNFPKSLVWKYSKERIFASDRGYQIVHDPIVSEFQDKELGMAKLQLLAHIIDIAQDDGKISDADLQVVFGDISAGSKCFFTIVQHKLT